MARGGAKNDPSTPGLFGSVDSASADRRSNDDRFSELLDQALIRAYVSAGRTLDDLPYTREVQSIILSVSEALGKSIEAREAILRLQRIRKRGNLPRLGASESPSIKVTPEEEALVFEAVKAHAGSAGQRDQLLYAPAFDEMLAAFNAHTGRTLSHHDLWRLVMKITK